MAHYFHHLTIVNRAIFICIAGALERYNNNNMKNTTEGNDGPDGPSKVSSILMFIYPMWNWLCVRYHYRLPFNLLMHNIVIVFEPITYFCNLVRPGTATLFIVHTQRSMNQTKFILGVQINQIINAQWIVTLTIINGGSMVLRLVMELGQTPMQEKIFPLIVAVASGAWIIHIWSNYFATYVAPVLD